MVLCKYSANNLLKNSNLDLIEFHLSYKICLDPHDFLKIENDMQFVVHAPELFPNDHILDLTSEKNSYVNDSIQYANQVLDLTRKFKTFPKMLNPPVIFNIGGASDKSFLNKEKTLIMKKIFKSLKELNLSIIDFIPQTMPLSWHFGGQRYHNLMVDLLLSEEFAISWFKYLLRYFTFCTCL